MIYLSMRYSLIYDAFLARFKDDFISIKSETDIRIFLKTQVFFSKMEGKKLRFQKYPEMCVRGLIDSRRAVSKGEGKLRKIN